jgi:predicted DNA-binding protein
MLREAEMSRQAQQVENRRSSSVVLEQFSTRLPPEVLTRLRVAAPQLGLRQSEIAATAIDRYLKRLGF